MRAAASAESASSASCTRALDASSRYSAVACLAGVEAWGGIGRRERETRDGETREEIGRGDREREEARRGDRERREAGRGKRAAYDTREL